MAEYQNENIYTSNIVDIIVALATVTNITIVAYYLDGLTVKNHVFKPTQKQSIAIIEVCFINGRYDLIVDATAQGELKYESIIFNQDFKTSAKKTPQKPPPLKTQHSLQFFSTTQRLKLSVEQQEAQQRPLMPNSYSPPVKQQLQKQSPDEWQPQLQELSSDEQQPQQSPSAGQYPILIEISSEEDLPEMPIASRNKTNSDNIISTTIIQNLSSDTSDEFEDVNVSYIGRRKYIYGLVFENIEAIKCDSVPPDIDSTVVYEVPIGSSGKLTHCKGLRPWGYAQSGKSKEFKRYARCVYIKLHIYLAQDV